MMVGCVVRCGLTAFPASTPRAFASELQYMFLICEFYFKTIRIPNFGYACNKTMGDTCTKD